MTEQLTVLFKIPHITNIAFAALGNFLVSKKNELPQDFAGSRKYVMLLKSEPSEFGGHKVDLNVVMAYPYAGGQHNRKMSPRAPMLELFKVMGVFPVAEGEYFERE